MPASTVTPVLRYRDPRAAADWLVHAFDFQIDQTAVEPDGEVKYISLLAGDSSVVIGPDSSFGDLMAQPSDLGGANTQTCYLAIDDIHTHCRTAQAAGATVVVEPETDDEGMTYYLCRDPEGHLWSFGTHAFTAARQPLPATKRWQPSNGLKTAIVLTIGVAIAIPLLIVAGSKVDPATGAAIKVPVREFAALRQQNRAERQKRLQAEAAARAAASRQAAAQETVEQLNTTLRAAQTEIGSVKRREGRAQETLSLSRQRAEELTRQFASLQERSRAERERRIEAEEAAAAAARKQAEARALSAELKTALSDATTAIERAKDRKRLAEEQLGAARDRSHRLLQSLKQSSDVLDQARSRISRFARLGSQAQADAAAAAQKLLKADRLNHALSEKLAAARQAVALLQREKQAADAALQAVQARFDQRLDSDEKRFAFVSSEFARVTRELNRERSLRLAATRSLEQTAAQLKEARSESIRLAGLVARLQQDVKLNHADIRVRYAILQTMDQEVAVPAKRWRVVVKPNYLPALARLQKVAVQNARLPVRRPAAAKPVLKAKPKPKPEPLVVPTAYATPCARAVYGQVLRRNRRLLALSSHIVGMLCSRAPSSSAPAACFQQLMSGRVGWGSGSRWTVSNALRLCSGTHSASSTLNCFRSQMAQNGDWRNGIEKCGGA